MARNIFRQIGLLYGDLDKNDRLYRLFSRLKRNRVLEMSFFFQCCKYFKILLRQIRLPRQARL